MKRESVVYVCSMCGKLSVMNDNSWEDASKARMSKTSQQLQIPQIIEHFENDITKWSHYQEFMKLVELTKDENLMSFPLCDHCMETATEHVLRLNDLIHQFAEDVASINNFGQDFSKTLVSNPDILSPFKIPERPVPAEPTPEPTPAVITSQSESRVEPVPRTITGRFAQLAAFRLSIDGQFGTINKQRLGTLPSCPVPVSEIQCALNLLVQLLVYEMRIAELSIDNVRLGARIKFIVKDSTKELRWPERSRDIDSFNRALTALMEAFNSVFNSKMLDRRQPANLIDTKKHTIGGVSYLYSKSEPENFVYGMRKLVVNLKTVQAFQTLFAVA